MKTSTTKDKTYTQRLLNLQRIKWKTLLHVQLPYIWNVKRLKPGITLDIGCGIGRYLSVLPRGSVGIDNNSYSVNYVRGEGLIAFTPSEFKRTKYFKKKYDSILMSHLLEHVNKKDSFKLINDYAPMLKDHGKIIIICPQEKGYASDTTHINFLNFEAIESLLNKSNFKILREYSFPFPRFTGKFFKYNEFIVLAVKK